MSSAALGKKEYQLLGKLLVQRHPEIAGEFLASFIEVKAHETDVSKLADYFTKFCKMQKLEPDSYRGALRAGSSVEIRRQFVSCMIHMYCPAAFVQPSDARVLRYKFLRTISLVLRIDESYVRRIVQEAIMQEKVYDDYKEKISEQLKLLQIINNGDSKKEEDR